MTNPLTQTNPFIDPFSLPTGGRLADYGQPLSPLQIPTIQTLVYKTGGGPTNLAMVNVSEALSKAGVTPQEPILVRDENVGIEVNLSLFGVAQGMQPNSQMSAAGIHTGQSVIKRDLPTNHREARAVLDWITSQRSGSRNTAFNYNELKRIAKNLDLPASGNKDVLANRIRTSIIEFFNLPNQ